MKEVPIGIVWRFGRNDYQIALFNPSAKEEEYLNEVMMSTENCCTCIRGDENLNLKDADVNYWEDAWAKEEAETKRKEVAHKVGQIIENDWNFYDDHEGTHWTEDDVYESLGSAKGSAYSIETLLQFYDGTDETKKYYDASMEIIHYMEWYQKGEN